jgi:nucleoside-diphosphate-sugar epimerase
MRKILVTGNQGYVGSRIMSLLRESFPGAQIVGYDAGYFANDLLEDQVVPEIAINNQIYGDIRNFDVSLMEGVDGLVLLAAVSNDPIGTKFADVTNEINALSNKRLIDLALKCRVRNIVFASSCSMYGSSESEMPKQEGDKLNPLTAYARSKVDIEEYLKNVDLCETIATSLRFSTACGASPRIRIDLVLNDFVYAAIKTNRIEILSDGMPWRPIIDVHDMGRAIVWALERDGKNNLSVNIGFNENNFQVYQIAEKVRGFLGNSVEIDINKNAMPDKRSYKVNFDLYKQVNPSSSSFVRIEKSIEQLASQMDLVIEKEKYIRLKKIEANRRRGFV